MEGSLRSVAEFPVYLSDTHTAGFCALFLVFQKREKKKRRRKLIDCRKSSEITQMKNDMKINLYPVIA